MAAGSRNCVGDKPKDLKTAGNALERQHYCLAITLCAQYASYHYKEMQQSTARLWNLKQELQNHPYLY